MIKADLIDAIAAETKFSKKDTDLFIRAFIENVSKALEEGDNVQLMGFGTFEVGKRAEREGRNPKTGEIVKIPASKTPKFKAGKALKDRVNK